MLGSGKKNTKIYKAEHIPTGKYYAIKEVEAKTLDKLNEYKVIRDSSIRASQFSFFIALTYTIKSRMWQSYLTDDCIFQIIGRSRSTL